MRNARSVSDSASGVGLAGLEFPLLKEQLDRLSGQGVDTSRPDLWHPNALLAAADLMGVDDSRAFLVNRQALMLATSLLTFEDENAQPVDLEVRYADGAVARLSLGFNPIAGEEGDASEASENDAPSESVPSKEKRLWVEHGSVDPSSIHALVEAFAKTTGTSPGGFASVVGAGAVLAAIQSMEAMNAASATFGFEGLGDENHSFEFVGVKLSVENAPAPHLTSGRGAPLKR